LSEEFAEEIIEGLHESGIILQEGLNISLSRSYCSNCKNQIHCSVKIDKETGEAKIHKTCTNNTCKCKCKTHYACKKCGRLHPYSMKCNNIEVETNPDKKSDEIFNKIIKEWRELEDSTQQVTKVESS